MFRSTVVKSLIAVAGIWLGWQSSASAQSSTPAADSTPQAFIATRNGDVGGIPRGKTVSHEFVIENRGQAPLEISTITKCGCTVVDHDKVIPPGGQGKIKVELRTSGLRGAFQKSIEVQTNDPARPSVQLVLSGRVVATLELVPDQVPRMKLKWDESTQQEIVLRTLEQVEVTGVTCAERYVQAGIEPTGKRSYRLRISVAADAPPGKSNFVLMLATTSESEPAVPITVYCEKGISVRPASFQFGSAPGGSAATLRSIVVLKNSGRKMQIRAAHSSDPDVEVQIVAMKAGELYLLKATYGGDLSTLGGSGLVTVETDDPQQPTLEIPIKTSPENSGFSGQNVNGGPKVRRLGG